ncbi:MAG: DUF1080 domain-containing protein [Planctomycetes bacterium]|nr:DUF1080 domain-containing protein [Planctomycetota bacterium]
MSCGERSRGACARWIVLAAAGLALFVGGGAPAEHWLTLLDGLDLHRWEPRGGARWAVEEEALAGRRGADPKGGEILNGWQFTDLELIARVRCEGEAAGAALLIRVSAAQAGYAVMLADGPAGPRGTLLFADGAVLARAGKPEERKAGEAWDEVRVKAVGRTIEVAWNGGTVARAEDGRFPRRGAVGFRIPPGETFGGTLRVRSVRARSLAKPAGGLTGDVPADDSYCHVCHFNFQDEELAATHAEEDIGCAACHGPSIDHRHDEDNVTPPDRIYRLSEIESACAECHERCAPSREAASRPLAAGRKVCTDCHGAHRVPTREPRGKDAAADG